MFVDGYTINEVAKATGRPKQTVHHWRRKMPVFEKKIIEARGDTVRDVFGYVTQSLPKAMDTIVKIATGEIEASPNVQLRACEILVERSGLGTAPQQHEQPASEQELKQTIAGIYGQPLGQQRQNTESEGEPEPAEAPKVRVAEDNEAAE